MSVRLAVGFLVAAGAVGQRVEACSCNGTPFTFAGNGLPRNARLPVLGPFVTGTAFELTSDGGVGVPALAGAVPGGFFVVPDGLLAANTDYQLSVDQVPIAFRTGDGIDQEAPPAPSLGTSTRSVSPPVDLRSRR